MSLSRRAFVRSCLAAGVGVATGGAAYGYFYGRSILDVTRVTVPVFDLPPRLAGLRIGLLTDVHCSEFVSPETIRRAADALRAASPDLIVLGGDYVTWGDRQYINPAAEALDGLTAPYGAFAVLGNHDDDRDVPAALTRHGFEVLKDARTERVVAGEMLSIVGIRFWTRRSSSISPLVRPAGGTVLLLAHDPRRIAEAVELDVPLVLSGHTHGGQVVLPVVGAVAARKFPVAYGLLQQRRTTMFVSRGLGTVYVPIRINCPPEVAILTLMPADQHQSTT